MASEAVKTVKIDAKAIREAMVREDKNFSELSEMLGHSAGYVVSRLEKGTIPYAEFCLLCVSLHAKAKGLEYKEPPKPIPAVNRRALSAGYDLVMEVQPDRVHLRLFFDSEELYHAYAKVRGDSELDLIQAISYASHLIYKFAEQKELIGNA